MYRNIQANALEQYPLHIAVDSVRDGGVDVLTEPLNWLIRNGPGIHAPDAYGRLPLHYAFIAIGEECVDESEKSIDPVAVVSVLEHAMERDKLDWPDLRGNTPLHYAARRDANVCAVTLLGRGCQLDRLNKKRNTPLGIAVLYRNEACTLTLIQAKSDVAIQVTSENKLDKVDDERWVWIPKRSKHQLPMECSSLVSLVVRNGWQAIIYVILNILGKNERTIGELLRAALQYRTYNLASTLLTALSQIVNEGE
ncbi:unnamed protein product [Anisakis simplex]|uniref:ANK_REP_REGION domain-containing protein n=1 Tax=Anisakis simplex TaxID=6269 RepID=A0A0M3J3U6_ANISI|nr:unnamed protein product [Anisakis simplex]